MEKLNLTGLKNEILIVKGKLVASEHMSEDQRNDLIKEIKNDLNNFISLLDSEIVKSNKIKNTLFEIANRF